MIFEACIIASLANIGGRVHAFSLVSGRRLGGFGIGPHFPSTFGHIVELIAEARTNEPIMDVIPCHIVIVFRAPFGDTPGMQHLDIHNLVTNIIVCVWDPLLLGCSANVVCI
jgi:hypothetical protein